MRTFVADRRTDRRQKEKMFSLNAWFDSDNEQYDDKMIYDIKMKMEYDIKPWQWWHDNDDDVERLTSDGGGDL